MATFLIHVDLCHSVALALHEQRVVYSESILCGWHMFFKTFRRKLYRKYNMEFDEDLEHNLQQAFTDFPNSIDSLWPCSGLDIIGGETLTLPLTGQELYKTAFASLEELTDFVWRALIIKVPHEYDDEIRESGITLSCENKFFLAVFAYHLKSNMERWSSRGRNIEVHVL